MKSIEEIIDSFECPWEAVENDERSICKLAGKISDFKNSYNRYISHAHLGLLLDIYMDKITNYNLNTIDEKCLWKPGEVIVRNFNRNYITVNDFVPKVQYMNLGFLIYSEIVKECFPERYVKNGLYITVADYLSYNDVDPDTGIFHPVKSEFIKYISSRELIIFKIQKDWNKEVEYMKGRIENLEYTWETFYNIFKFVIPGKRAKYLSSYNYLVAFSEDHLKKVVTELKEKSYKNLISEIERADKRIEKCKKEIKLMEERKNNLEEQIFIREEKLDYIFKF